MVEAAYTTKGIEILDDMSRWTVLGINGMVEWWSGELRLAVSVGCEIWHLLVVCVIWSWISRIGGKQPTETSL